LMFYLGTHRPNWLGLTDVPLFVSHRTIKDRKTFPKAKGRWALDSGAFTEISKYGKWVTTEDEYVEAVARYEAEIGGMDWAAPMDWMCEPHMIELTGLSVAEHQHRTIENYLAIRGRGPFIPVLQGWEPQDYMAHVAAYADAGIDLSLEPTVGVGSVCRRQATAELVEIMRLIREAGISSHGFGVKAAGIHKCGDYMKSADSMAWSFTARYSPPMAGHTHKTCANCLEYALKWRQQLVGGAMLRELPGLVKRARHG